MRSRVSKMDRNNKRLRAIKVSGSRKAKRTTGKKRRKKMRRYLPRQPFQKTANSNTTMKKFHKTNELI
jgi:hypothetical protein